jgi:hypothetical protein
MIAFQHPKKPRNGGKSFLRLRDGENTARQNNSQDNS